MLKGPIPEYVDAYQAFAQETRISATLRADQLSRFAQYLYAADGEGDQGEQLYTVELYLFRDEAGRRKITGSVSGEAQLQCQRCLGPVDYTLESELDLVVVDKDEAARELIESGEEPVLSRLREDQRVVELLPLLEDELILVLPTVPKHIEGSCAEGNRPAAPSASVANRPKGIAGDDEEMQAKLLALKASLSASKSKQKN